MRATAYTRQIMLVSAAVLTAGVLLLPGRSMLPEPADAGLLPALALASSVGQALFAWGHAHLPVSVSATLQLAVPVFAAAISWSVLGETLTGVQLLGGGVLIGSLAVLVTAPQS